MYLGMRDRNWGLLLHTSFVPGTLSKANPGVPSGPPLRETHIYYLWGKSNIPHGLRVLCLWWHLASPTPPRTFCYTIAPRHPAELCPTFGRMASRDSERCACRGLKHPTFDSLLPPPCAMRSMAGQGRGGEQQAQLLSLSHPVRGVS